ncbi:cyclase family protein [Treponema primitia ZAS-2]|uniref:Cyclase family protein n=1 Tax=Treponema primitia (strain ATCC BAA-887 / DSM 12427 / ZAS-2) TaxID=545694 RepID=F5YLN4_TREPZ|nr:cyclase family protein [Treponema primitia]AEF84959.1 cyclase family protein [Treponema primitia ZAS-2]
MFKLLSYTLSGDSPGWPGNPALALEEFSSLAKGNAANTCMVHFHNHSGTHIDGPNHYISGGAKIADLPLDYFIYERPLLLDIPKSEHEKIGAADLRPHENALARADLLMLRTGFSKYRDRDPARYGAEGPCITPDCAEYLVTAFESLKALAIDFVSIASYRDQEAGNEAHRILLGEKGHFICPIEDVNLGLVDKNALKRVFALPFFIGGADSTPVTVIAEEE